MRKPIVAANWKMNAAGGEGLDLAAAVVAALDDVRAVDVVLCPPFTVLGAIGELLHGTRLMLGAQNAYHEPAGAYTGEIAPGMLRDLGCDHVILGHSERRSLLGETDSVVRAKVDAALDADLTPIVCLGETLAEREAGQTESVLNRQFSGSMGDLGRRLEEVVVAYEPVWAIGTGRTATPEQVQHAHAHLRALAAAAAGASIAEGLKIQYGGSVKPDNAGLLFGLPDVDGGLIGGASLDAASFAAIVGAAIPS